MKSFIKKMQLRNALWLPALVLSSLQLHAQQLATPSDNAPTGNTITLSPADSFYPGLINMTNASGNYNYVKTIVPDVPLQSLPASGIYDRVSTDYFDGLGRPLQSVGQRAHADGNDIVVPHVYDALGRETYQYQPYAAPTGILANPGKMKLNVSTQLHTFYNLNGVDEQPYSQTVFENSPLNRVTKQMAPGKSWVGSQKGASTNYYTNGFWRYQLSQNSAALLDGGYPRWTIASGAGALPVYAGQYAAGQLYITESTDEDGKKMLEAKDKQGRVVMKMAGISSGLNGQMRPVDYVYTHYVYDDLGNLRCVIPPAVKAAPSGTTGSISWGNPFADQVNNLCYTYLYDERNRMVEKKIPGKDVEYFVYDKRDRLVAYQDGDLRNAGNKWNFTYYDALDRVTMTAWGYPNYDRAGLQNLLTIQYPVGTNSWLYYLNNYGAYPNIPPALDWIYPTSYTYYDDYSNIPGFSFDASQFSNVSLPTDGTVTPSVYSPMTRGLVTGTKVRLVDPDNVYSDTWLSSVNYYNDKGRLIQTQSQNIDGGIDISSNIYYFQGALYKNILTHHNPHAHTIAGASDGPITEYKLENTFQRNFGINGGNDQVWKHTQKINNSIDYELAYYGYDHLGRVVTKQFTAGNLLQDYSTRGFLTQINFRDPTGTITDTIFQEQLYYDMGFGNKFLNGNIAGITWRNHDGIQKSYGYSYDGLNRLNHAEFRQKDGSGWGKAKDYTASNITYDYNGNILSMNQMAPVSGINTPMDVLTYKYAPNSNQLINVADAGTVNASLPDFKDGATNTGATEYLYDNNGNLTKDDNKNITSITYNYINKPERITVGGSTPGTITYVYDAAGNKLQKKIYNAQNGQTETWHYTGNFVYKDNTLQYILNDEGRARPVAADAVPNNPALGTPTKFVYDYFIKDHLGNVRSTVTSEPINYNYLARHEIVSANIEQLVFDNIPNVRDLKPGSTDPNDGMAAGLDASDPNTRIGTAILLKAFPGDKFRISADAFYDGEYENQGTVSGNEIVQSLVAALTGGATYAGIPLSELPDNAKLATSLLNGNPQLGTVIQNLSDNNNNPDAPKAHLNYLYFDERMQLRPEWSGSVQVPVNANGTGSWVTLNPGNGGDNPILCHNCGGNVNPGYFLVYVDNQSIGKKVWFDNVAINEYTSKVTEEDHYYPFGLTLNTLNAGTVPNGVKQPYKYNGKELEQNFGLETFEYGARQYDPQIARWKGIDPLADKYYGISPFAYVANNPVTFIDPNGKELVIGANNAKQVMSDLQSLTSDKLSRNDKTGAISIVSRGKGKSAGTQLIRDIVGHRQTTTVDYNGSQVGSGTSYRNDKGAEYGGTDVKITLSSNNGESQYEVGGKTVSLKQDEKMVLGGELIHALVAMDGHKDPNGDGSHTYTNVFGDKQVETRDRDELAAHGIGKWHYNPSTSRTFYPTENDLRKENHQPKRVAYEDDIDYKYKPENKQKLEQYEKQGK